MFRDPHSGQIIPADPLLDDEIVERSDPAFAATAFSAWFENMADVAEDDEAENSLAAEDIPNNEDETFNRSVESLAGFLWSETTLEEMAWAEEIESEPIPDDDPIEPDLLAMEMQEKIEIASLRPLPLRPDHRVSKHAGRKLARKGWARHQHRFPLHGVTEADIASEAAFHDGFREAIERKLAERGIHGVKVVVIQRRRAA